VEAEISDPLSQHPKSGAAISNPAAHGGLVTEERFSELPLQILLLFPDYQIMDMA
jgi:hypothetical protein